MNSRRNFLKAAAAAVAGLGTVRELTPHQASEDALLDFTVSLSIPSWRRERLTFKSSMLLPGSIDSALWKVYGMSEEDVLALAQRSLVMNVQATARRAVADSIEKGDKQEDNQRALDEAVRTYRKRRVK